MEILSLTLKNFKSHSDRHFTFQPGTNAICGENGAGKTSILEAIAWTLFDYTGGYSKEDLIRNGFNSAQVRVAFISSRDDRTYEVQRCTSKGYTLFDPQLNERLPYSLIKEEVLPWMRQHLGVLPGTDLGKLFASTIGVPQGTFTADFLLSKENRKPIFDKILKVEEYQQTWKNLSDLEKYAKHQVEKLQEQIKRYDDELVEFNDKQQERQQQWIEIEQVQAELAHLQLQVTQLHQEQDMLAAQAVQVQQCDVQLKSLNQQLQNQATAISHAQTDLQQADNAAAICLQNRDAYNTYLQADTTLQTLQHQLLAEQKLQQEKRQQEKQLSDRATQLVKLNLQLSQLADAKAEIAQLQPFVQDQIDLEQKQQAIGQQLQNCLSIRRAIHDQERLTIQTQARQTQLEAEISEVRSLEASVRKIPELEHQQQRYQQQLSRIAAATQFEADLRQLLTQTQVQGDRYQAQIHQATIVLRDLQQSLPTWAAALEQVQLTLQTGTVGQQQLTQTLQAILTDLTEQTVPEKLEQQLRSLDQQLRIARQNQARLTSLERLMKARSQLSDDLEALQISLAELHTQLEAEPTLRQQQTEFADALAILNDPRIRIRLRQEQLRQEMHLQTQVQHIQASFGESEAILVCLEAQLATFATVSTEMQQQQALKEAHYARYEEYLKYRELANERKQRRLRVQEVSEQSQTLEQAIKQIAADRDRLSQTFDAAHFQTIQTAYQTAKERCIALNASLPDKLKILETLEHQIAKLQATKVVRDRAQTELEQKRKSDRFIKFARKAYKEAGPRITERYIKNISHEADRLFRELLNRPNVGLEWTRDYEVLVQEGAHTRRLINLSGGEQMCAALAVRLALLKVLAAIDIAFFDEPTTNMDRPRREHLAEAIANIKTFRQLFVISHDDTFEKVTENVIFVEREN